MSLRYFVSARFLLTLALLTLAAQASAVDRNAFTFTQYDLAAQITPAQQSLAVTGKIKLRNDSSTPQRIATLQISSTLDWRSIKVGGKPVQFLSQLYASDIDHTGDVSEAIVTLPAAIPPKSSVELEVAYEGAVPANSVRLTRIGTPAEVAAHSDWDQISSAFTAVRGVGYVAWYPVAIEAASLSEGDELFSALGEWKQRESQSTMRVNFCWTAEAPLTVVANGQLEGIGRRAGAAEGTVAGCAPYRFPQIGLLVPTFAIADYSTLDRPGVTAYHLPEHKLAAEDYVNTTEKLAPFVGQWFGPMREKVKIVELADAKALPFESGPMLFAPLKAVLNDPQQRKPLELTLVHQLAHASIRSPRPWIYEGLAHFAQVLEREQQDGRQAAVDYMKQHLPALRDAERVQSKRTVTQSPPDADSVEAAGTTSQSLIAATGEVFYRSKAMYVWWMLRDMAGDTALHRAVQSYRADDDREPSYMQRLIEAQTTHSKEAQAKHSLEWFFDDWVYRDRGLPELRVESAYPRQMLRAGYLVTVTVKNTGHAGAETPVIVRLPDGREAQQKVLVPADGTGVIRVEVPAAPSQAVVNDGSIPESEINNNTFKIDVPQ
jgi:hypothetical protein